MKESMFTCTACSISFATYEEQKTHFRTDWHRYNLKRKIATLPPVTLAQFNVRKQLAAKNHPSVSAAAFFKATCRNCKKHFSTEKALKQHLASKKHQQIIKKQVEDVIYHQEEKVVEEEEEEMEEEELGEFEPELCLFCNKTSENLESNLIHMQREHGFFIPDFEYIVDIEGLLSYLTEKIRLGKMCLYCNGKGKVFASYQDCQKHMVDKSHCKLLYQPNEDLDEYLDFYDFSASYDTKEGDQDWESESESDEDDDEWQVVEDQDKESSLVESKIEFSETGEMILQDGRRVGRRQYRRYYRQHIKPEDARASAIAAIKEHVTRAYEASKGNGGYKRGFASAAEYAAKNSKRGHLKEFKSIKESIKARTMREKHRNRLDFRSHKMQTQPNRKVMVTV